MTEFRRLAERIADNIDDVWFCCVDLPEEQVEFFTEWFKPTLEEMDMYNHTDFLFMSELGVSRIDNNNFRILSLLFAEQLWLDMKEGNG